MKLDMHTNHTKQRATLYRYVKIKTEQPEQPPIFLYVGTSVEYFDNLRRELGTGWMLAGISDAIQSLRGLPAAPCTISSVFVDDSDALSEGFSALRALRKLDILKDVPVVANMRAMDNAALKALRRTPVVDELMDFRVETSFVKETLASMNRVRQAVRARGRNCRLEKSANQVHGRFYLGKRIIDVIAASSLLVLTLPILLLIAFAVKIESRGPVLYNSYRAGRGYRIFRFFKFRTMRVGADRMIQSIAHLNKYNNFGHAPVFFKADNDPRITRVGKFLRSSGLDELPQLFNVLLGDMSIVGNRPLPLYEASALTSDESADRFMAPAGITGLWQVTCRDSGGYATSDRIEKDLEYVHRSCFAMDMAILARTVVVLIRGMYSNRLEFKRNRIFLNRAVRTGVTQFS
jgi:lipopolysaccharide/colanic/teichoic acid biosynthesis glycosyltransferase